MAITGRNKIIEWSSWGVFTAETLPAESDVRYGIGYGTSGTEFLGSLTSTITDPVPDNIGTFSAELVRKYSTFTTIINLTSKLK